MKIAGTSLEPLFFWKKGHSLADAVDFASSTAATLARLGSGGIVRHLGNRPAKLFELYDREGHPQARKIREALSILDLDAVIHPCPLGGKRFQAKVEERISRFDVPLFIDPNSGFESTDADAVVRHLFRNYGDGLVPLSLRLGNVTNATSTLATTLRHGHGQKVETSKDPDQLLELYSYEASPYARLVREVLSEMELPYILHNVARHSPRRPAFVERTGKMQIPYLVDSTHGVAMFESKEIIEHLESTYGKANVVAA
ncbi:MAG: glutathione S-transferase N-terminal domain-containing protein [Polyangiaceae bacterium]